MDEKEFEKKEKQVEELRGQIEELENEMEVCAYGRTELYELASMYEELAKLEKELYGE